MLTLTFVGSEEKRIEITKRTTRGRGRGRGGRGRGRGRGSRGGRGRGRGSTKPRRIPTVTKKSQHHTLLSNLGRVNTYIRFVIEKSLGTFTKVWGVWRFCPWWSVDLLGYHLKATTAINTFFKKGVIDDTEERLKLSRFIQQQMLTYLAKHPISTALYEDSMKRTRIKSDDNSRKSFIEVCKHVFVFFILKIKGIMFFFKHIR